MIKGIGLNMISLVGTVIALQTSVIYAHRFMLNLGNFVIEI